MDRLRKYTARCGATVQTKVSDNVQIDIASNPEAYVTGMYGEHYEFLKMVRFCFSHETIFFLKQIILDLERDIGNEQG